ncbi:MAG: hypothetical protein ACOY99_01615 [Pseudomonadota bacterium]
MSPAPIREVEDLPTLGDEPLALKLRRYGLALAMAVGVMAALGGLFFLLIALALPFTETPPAEDATDVSPPPAVAEKASVRPTG